MCAVNRAAQQNANSLGAPPHLMATLQSTRDLSSRATTPIRLGYLAIVAALAAGAVFAILGDSALNPLGLRIVFAILVLSAAGYVVSFFTFVAVRLVGNSLEVRGLWRTWTVPLSHVTDIREGTNRGLTAVRVSLAQAIPGLGSRFRFVAPFIRSDGGAEPIRTALRPPPGA